MISRDEVIELVRSTADKDKTDPVYLLANDRVEFGVFSEGEFIRFAQACYRKGVEDAAWVCDELANNEVVSKHVSSGHCLVTRSGMYRCAESIRALLDHSVDSSNMEVA